jgi:hypothetical protein
MSSREREITEYVKATTNFKSERIIIGYTHLGRVVQDKL